MSTGKIIALLVLSMVPLSIGLVAILNVIHPNSEGFREAPAHNAQRHSQQAMPVPVRTGPSLASDLRGAFIKGVNENSSDFSFSADGSDPTVIRARWLTGEPSASADSLVSLMGEDGLCLVISNIEAWSTVKTNLKYMGFNVVEFLATSGATQARCDI